MEGGMPGKDLSSFHFQFPFLYIKTVPVSGRRPGLASIGEHPLDLPTSIYSTQLCRKVTLSRLTDSLPI